MTETRKLAAILAADVVGYSRLASSDEDRILARLRALRSDLIDPTVAVHKGRVVKRTGDGSLIEFRSVVDAVRCAIEVQNGMVERNAGVPPERRIEFRVGIHLGDVVEESDGDLMGDGVNIAARLEGIAKPGSICLSEDAYRQVRARLDLAISDLGSTQLKNIAEPIRVYSLEVGVPAQAKPPAQVAPAAPENSPTLALPDKPSIAVLAFQNMSGDAEQEYFADGISEDIITALSKLRWFFVIARNSSFAYRGKSVDVRTAARELGVRYVLEGSVRKGGNRVRITAQLIDAATGNHIWADRYDGDLADVFELQDDITKKVVAAIEPKLLEAEAIRSQNRSSDDLGAWDLVMRANSLLWRHSKADSETAIAMLTKATERYPDYTPGYSMLAFALLFRAISGGVSTSRDVKDAAALATRAIELDDNDPWAHVALGYADFLMRRTDHAIQEFQRGLEINPNFAAAHGYLGTALACDGRSDQAIYHSELALRMSPHDPQIPIFNVGLAAAHFFAGSFAEAIGCARKAVQQRSGWPPGHRIYCASLAQAGQLDEARTALGRLKELQPDISIAWIEQNVPYRPAAMAKLLDGLRKAGLE